MKTVSAKLLGERNLIREERDLVLNENEVLVETYQSSICDADLRAYRGLFMPTDLPPFVFIGHEGGGTVVEVGSRVHEFKVGDKVMLFGPHSSFSKYFKAPVQDLHKAPEGMDMKIASLGEPISVGMFGVAQSEVQLGDTVVVAGLNFQGLLAVQGLKKRGAGKVIAIDYSDKHLEIARKTGADITINTTKEKAFEKVLDLTNGRRCDVVYHSCGYWNPRAEEYLNLGIDLTRDEGTFVSLPDLMSSPMLTNLHRLHHHGINIKFAAVMHHSPAFRQIWVPRLMRMVSEGGIDIKPLITGTFKIDNVLDAMKAFDSDPDHVKVTLEP